MSYYRICPHCGAHLDPGEACDCRDKTKTAPSAANTEDGQVEQSLPDTDSASTIYENGGNVK